MISNNIRQNIADKMAKEIIEEIDKKFFTDVNSLFPIQIQSYVRLVEEDDTHVYVTNDIETPGAECIRTQKCNPQQNAFGFTLTFENGRKIKVQLTTWNDHKSDHVFIK